VLDSKALTTAVDVILNRGSGTLDNGALADTITDFLMARRMTARIHVTENGRELLAASERAASGDAAIVVAGGGDGTIATVAQFLTGTDKPLGVLPLGTFNYFARNLGLPLDLTSALEVVVEGTCTTVDVGDVNGHVFLNNSSIGLYPALLRRREATYRRFGRSQLAAYLSVVLLLLEPPGFVNLTLTADGTRLSRRTPLLYIGTNSCQMESFGIAGRECLEGRRLALCITRPMGALALSRLAMQAVFRGLHGSDAFEAVCATEILVGLRRSRVRVALDGEVRVLATPLRYRMMHDALRVLVPRQPPSAG
jgi:diacylglycerol kinase family enzyme